jgi:hypothetical protein
MMRFKSALLTLLTAGALWFVAAPNVKAQALAAPTAADTEQARRNGPCRDPWVTIALTYNRLGTYAASSTPTFIAGRDGWGDCNTALYNGGSWNSFAELVKAVQKTSSALSGANFSYVIVNLGGGQVKIKSMSDGVQAGIVVLKLVGNSGGTLITNDGGTLVASGGGNFSVQSTATQKKINLGGSVLIIKKP